MPIVKIESMIMARVRTPGRVPRRKRDRICISQQAASIHQPSPSLNEDLSHSYAAETPRYTVEEARRMSKAGGSSAVDVSAKLSTSGVTLDNSRDRGRVFPPIAEDMPSNRAPDVASLDSAQSRQTTINADKKSTPTFPTERFTAIMMNTFKQTTPTPQLDRTMPGKRARTVQGGSVAEPPKKRGRPSNANSAVKKHPPGRPKKVQSKARQPKTGKTGQPAVLTQSRANKQSPGLPTVEPTRRVADPKKARSASGCKSLKCPDPDLTILIFDSHRQHPHESAPNICCSCAYRTLVNRDLPYLGHSLQGEYGEIRLFLRASLDTGANFRGELLG